MRQFERKKSFGRFLSSPVILVVLLLAAVFLARGAWNIYLKARSGERELAISNTRLSRLAERQMALSAATAKLETETGVEAEIRDRFHMGWPGERSVVIVEEESKNSATAAPAPNFLQKLWNFFTIR